MTRQELLAIVEAIKHLHHYVYGVPTLVRTNCGVFTWFLSFKNPEGQMARLLEVIGEYNLTIKHRAGRLHGNADTLSRRSCNNCKHCESKEIKHSKMKNVIRIRFMANREGGQLNELAGWVEVWQPAKLSSWKGEDPVISKVLGWVIAGENPSWKKIKTEGHLL